MAIIIGAIILAFVAVCSYLNRLMKNARNEGKAFYDIFFLAKFLQYVAKENKWSEFIRNNNLISVKRRYFTETGVFRLDEHKLEKNNLFNLILYEESISQSRKKHYLEYVFEFLGNQVKFIAMVDRSHEKLFRAISNTTFEVVIDKNKIKMTFGALKKDVIYVSSYEAAYQSLALALQSKEHVFVEEVKSVLRLFGEINTTFDLIKEIKELIYFYDGYSNAKSSANVKIFSKRDNIIK